MNKKVLWSMIVLLWVFLFGFMAIKLFFGHEFAAVIENERIQMIGSFIDDKPLVSIGVDILLSSLCMHFYLCACKRVWKLKRINYVALVAYVSILVLIYRLSSTVGAIIDLLGMLIIPYLLKSSRDDTMSIFILHQIGQIMTLYIRSDPLYLVSTDYATQFIIVFDLYVWLVLYYLYSNLYKEESIWVNLLCPFSVIREKLNTKRKSKD